jgi:hypothetical protein
MATTAFRNSPDGVVTSSVARLYYVVDTTIQLTLHTIEASPLEVESVEHGEMPKAPPLVRPMVFGAAFRSV